MEKQVFVVGERADKLCAKCDEGRGHIVTAVTKRGQISRVSCTKVRHSQQVQTQFSNVASSGGENPFAL
jgi:hypothetical protein